MSAAAALFASSGSLLADRRYEYARGAAADGDDAAAAGLLEQALEIAPRWAAAWFALGAARARAGARGSAGHAYAQALVHAPDDPYGAALHLALLNGAAAPAAMPQAYVRGLFDQYAPRFDAHLTEALAYRGPALVAGALRAVCGARGRPFHFGDVVDLGCGTGLMARALHPHFDAVHGVDLSAGMIAEASKTGLYASLAAADMITWLQDRPAASAALAAAADVLVYAGDLAPLFSEIARALTPDPPGLFAFTAQHYEGDGYALGKDMRFAHSEDYLRAAASAAGLRVALLRRQSTRRDAGRDVPGLVCVLAAAPGRLRPLWAEIPPP